MLVVLIDDVGEDTGTPVNFNCDVPFRFTGALNKVTIELKPQPGDPLPPKAQFRDRGAASP